MKTKSRKKRAQNQTKQISKINAKRCKHMEHGVQSYKNQTDGKMQIEKQKKDSNLTGKDKAVCAISYIWILFFLPLVVYGNDPYAKRCANEQLNLFIFGAIGNLIFGVLVGIFALFLPVLSAIFSIVVSVWNFCLLIFGIVGIINVVSGNNKSLPIFGAFSIIK